MPKCPKCGSEISYLVMWELEWVCYHVSLDKRGNLEFIKADYANAKDPKTEFLCPSCGEKLKIKSHEEAEMFLKGELFLH